MRFFIHKFFVNLKILINLYIFKNFSYDQLFSGTTKEIDFHFWFFYFFISLTFKHEELTVENSPRLWKNDNRCYYYPDILINTKDKFNFIVEIKHN